MSYSGSVPDTAPRPLDWLEQAACRDDADMFFDAQRVHEARVICVVHCPVRAQCLADIMAREQGRSENARDEGVFAGLDRRQRWRHDPTAAGKHADEAPAQWPECGTAAALELHLAQGEPVCGVCWSGELRRRHATHRRHVTDSGPDSLPEAS
ncbi:WhiB family transcriptional regulator [Streptomyces sp. G1]|uniref:WhiB family transcriptional regulator n=1 Tax=Streptomyces sp. G1 TaxID=361572 RepID=UPI00202E7C2E|nr:WhiB family transcriptional regulator [Streptomyces sp. G1]MCM1977171.1 WhiB family transcriptional regulator [Streptomyces sp. G1]